MEFRVLGPLEVLDDGRALDLGAAKQRALLAVLLLNANHVVSRDRLIEALWGERAPDTALKALQVYVSGLRKTLGRDRIVTRAPGYELRIEPGELDLERLETLASEGRYDDALALWRGSPLVDFAYEPFAQSEIARLDDLRLSCLERRIEGELRVGGDGRLVSELEALVREHPLRERLRAQLMLALYRAGRQAEALETYADGRRVLTDELGLEPGAELKELQRRILAQDPALEPPGVEIPAHGEPLPAQPVALPSDGAPREARKTVTVLACDLAATRELDPESFRRMSARGLEELMSVLDRHGATVERSMGGGVTAIFGIPAVHEDDALRAVDAAEEMRQRLAGMRDELEASWGASLLLRAGIGTGEVVTGATEGRQYATGEPVRLALRLHAAAAPGEVLLEDRTLRLVRHAVDIDQVGELARLTAVSTAEQPYRRPFASPMVGRERERRRLQDAFDEAIVSRSCQLFTLLGSPGVGKSRLVQEFVEELAGRALVARGRCLPYGEGITYWPVLEVVRDVAGLDDSLTPDDSRARLAELVEGEEDAELVVQRLGEVTGLSDELAGMEERLWAVRTFFEALARQQPLVVVFDDIHWGEETFLDLVDHLADWGRDAPILLVCVARPELLDVRPSWGGGKMNATSTLLEPLSEAESCELVANLAATDALDERERRRIVEAAGGNPLFVEELLALVLEEGASDISVPPTIHALIAARLDRLADDERAAIEAAAVEGQVFHDGSVTNLVQVGADDVQRQLLALVRRDLVRPDRSVFAGERGYRFRHILIRDAAYESIPKERRAILHERHAAWLEARTADRALEFEEILGYHLEQAFRYRTELGPPDEAAHELAVGAGRRLATASRRALARGDTPAAMNLAARAAALLPPDDPLRVHIVPGVRIVQGLGGELGWADAVLSEAIASGDRRLEAHARVQRALLHLFTETTVDVDVFVAEATAAIDVFEELGDELGLARAWRLLQQARYLGRQSAASVDAAERALEHARKADDVLEEVEIIDWLGVAIFMGATPAPEAARRVEAHLEAVRAGRGGESVLLACLAGLMAMQGRLAEARALIDRARPVVDEPAYMSRQYVVPFHWGWTELLADDPAAAERALRPTLAPLEAIGETSAYCAIVALLAEAVYRQGRHQEAEELTRISEKASHLNDVFAHITWRPVRAKALARRGAFDEAEELAAETLAFASESDFLNAHGDALLDLAEVRELAGRPDEALPALEQALALFEQKGNVVSAARARSALERLRAG
jgi:DNA-binding SARP family transcriptional activator/class 3 adenylate cyclase/tetratricopeptide (TPR) repeat protein